MKILNHQIRLFGSWGTASKAQTGIFALFLLVFACTSKPSDAVFIQLSKNKTGLDFRNLIIEKETFNIFKYQYFYNGGGVASGDFNNDGLQDLVFTGNMVKNRLYVNQGNLSFKDVTLSSHIAEQEGWCTGVTTADVNCDGWLDIYICRAGYPFEKLTRNMLYINNGDLTFTDKAAEYGLDDKAHSTQAAFFDYDKDNDLDLLLINHSDVQYSRGSLEVLPIRKIKKPETTNKLYRNDGGHFHDVTQQAGITSNVLSFSLGLNIADINGDNWPDIFIGNDFNEPDYLFINNQNGTFTDHLTEAFDHVAMFSMGGDVADINNDGLPDIVSLDMLPEGHHAQKMHSGADNFDKIDHLIRNGFFRQYSRNMLQVNNGDGTFSECGQLAGVSNTDWSWSPLLFDFDNDGLKDLFVSNGYLRDHTDMDFLKFTEEEVMRIKKGEPNIAFADYMAKMPAINQPNYFYQNKGNLLFEDKTKAWGLHVPSVSHGAVYADFDNDGDLDIATNMSNEEAGFYENRSNRIASNHFVKIALKSPNPCNAAGIGSKVYLHAGTQIFYQELQPVRGFQSCGSHPLHFGIGSVSRVDSVVVIWNSDERQVLTQCPPDQLTTIEQDLSAPKFKRKPPEVTLFKPVATPPEMTHRENAFADFHYQYLLPWHYSKECPALAVADLNGDNYPDAYLGGATGHSGQLFLSDGPAQWSRITTPFEPYSGTEDQAAAFFDADGDADLDLYVATGSYDQAESATPSLEDELYINQGGGRFQKSPLPLPAFNAGCVAAADADGDGDTDVFVGALVIPGRFPQNEQSVLLLNDGKGRFSRTPVATQGLVKGAVWADLNGDQQPELTVAAEWAALQTFQWQNGRFTPVDNGANQAGNGLWQSIHAADLDQDGDMELVAGNIGLNNQLYASKDQPMTLWFSDFDQNGTTDPILCRFYEGKSHPIASKEDLTGQLKYLNKRYLYFKDYAAADIAEILGDKASTATMWEVHTLETMVFWNNKGRLEAKPLPRAAQIAPVRAIAHTDADRDGQQDLILAGNIAAARIKLGRLDGNHGLCLKNTGEANFEPMPYTRTGLQVRGDTRALCVFSNAKQSWLFFGVNDGPVRIYSH